MAREVVFPSGKVSRLGASPEGLPCPKAIFYHRIPPLRHGPCLQMALTCLDMFLKSDIIKYHMPRT